MTIDTDLYYLTATAALELFKGKKLSPVELMTAVIKRAEATEPSVNALAHQWFDEGLEKAKEAEKAYMAGSATGILAGIPVALKNETFYEGKPIDIGSLALKDHICDHSHPAVEAILGEGAIIHASTQVPEFCAGHFTRSSLYGSTATPWNTGYNSGGSSGGSGAALAVGSTILATGTDIAGSIRIPSSFCGVVGLKPAYGRVAEDPPFNLESYNHTGPMARSVSDCALLFNAMAGPHPKDIISLRPKMQVPLTYGSIKGMKVAYSPDLGFMTIDPEITKAMQQAAAVFRDAGAVVEEVDLGWNADIKEACSARLAFMFREWIRPHAERAPEVLNDYLVKYLEELPDLTTEMHLRALKTETQMYLSLGKILDTYDVLICPTSAVTGLPRDINTHTLSNVYETLLTYPFNMLSRCPVMSLPVGFAGNGVPIGMQIVGRTYDEPTVFKMGYAYEQATGWTKTKRPDL